MELSIIGFANSGKTTLFNAITGSTIEVSPNITTDTKPVSKLVNVPDSRVDYLSTLFKPLKTTYTTIRCTDFIGITKGDTKKNRMVLNLIKDSDAIVNVVRAFGSEGVIHPLESVDYFRDILLFESEMILMDLELVENRIMRIEEGEKKGKKGNPEERAILDKCYKILSQERPLREIEFSEEELMNMRHLQFASIKPQLIVINVDESTPEPERREMEERVEREFIKGRKNLEVITLSAKVESEISLLSLEERRLFLREMGIERPAFEKVIESSYKLLGLISFLTVGEDEVRAWTIKRGSNAQQAAGQIHSEIAKGLIRAEVVSYDDFKKTIEELGGRLPSNYMEVLKSKNRLRLEPKEYIVKDGDIINFRHAK